MGKSPNDLPETYRNVAKNNGNRRSTTLADGNCRIGSFGPDFRGVHGLQYTNLGRNLTKPFEERLFNMVKPCTFHHARQTWTFEMNPARVIALASRNKNALSCKSTVEFHSASWYVCKYSRVTCIHVSAFGWKYGTKVKTKNCSWLSMVSSNHLYLGTALSQASVASNWFCSNQKSRGK